MTKFLLTAIGAIIIPWQSHASTYPKVDSDLAEYDRTVAQMRSDFSITPADPQDKTWVQSKLDFMFKVDQYMRSYVQIPFQHGYTAEEQTYFWSQFSDRFKDVDSADTADLKDLLKIYNWFRISMFGAQADSQAWLIVQHADQDVPFQKQVLSILEKLYPLGETKPANYAYLYDRVAGSWQDPTKRTLQRYGTQGQCVEPGKWEPIAIEDADHVDERRAAMGMESMADYKARFKDLCH